MNKSHRASQVITIIADSSFIYNRKFIQLLDCLQVTTRSRSLPATHGAMGVPLSPGPAMRSAASASRVTAHSPSLPVTHGAISVPLSPGIAMRSAASASHGSHLHIAQSVFRGDWGCGPVWGRQSNCFAGLLCTLRRVFAAASLLYGATSLV